jgi:hypothetical protein
MMEPSSGGLKLGGGIGVTRGCNKNICAPRIHGNGLLGDIIIRG